MYITMTVSVLTAVGWFGGRVYHSTHIVITGHSGTKKDSLMCEQVLSLHTLWIHSRYMTYLSFCPE